MPSCIFYARNKRPFRLRALVLFPASTNESQTGSRRHDGPGLCTHSVSVVGVMRLEMSLSVRRTVTGVGCFTPRPETKHKKRGS